MRVHVNGREMELREGGSLFDLLADLGVESQAVAVVRNGEIVARQAIAATVAEEGDVLEIVRFVGGG